MPVPRLPEVIETDRLVLRRQRADDAAAYRAMWAERDPRVPPHRRIGPDGRPTIEDITARMRTEAEAGLRTITLQGDVLGYCGLIADGRGAPDEPELAYELLRRAHGYGYATEAARAVVACAAEAGCARLWAGVREWNVASRNVLRKVGFVESRVEPDAEFGDTLLTVIRLQHDPR